MSCSSSLTCFSNTSFSFFWANSNCPGSLLPTAVQTRVSTHSHNTSHNCDEMKKDPKKKQPLLHLHFSLSLLQTLSLSHTSPICSLLLTLTPDTSSMLWITLENPSFIATTNHECPPNSSIVACWSLLYSHTSSLTSGCGLTRMRGWIERSHLARHCFTSLATTSCQHVAMLTIPETIKKHWQD